MWVGSGLCRAPPDTNSQVPMLLRLFQSVLFVVLCASSGFFLLAAVDADAPWMLVTSSDGSEATARHEAAAVAVGNRFYLLGGRGNRPLEIFDTATRTWRNLGRAPIELHHFQPVVVGQKIYAVGAFTCCYPDEPSVADIYVFDTVSEQWSTQGLIPEGRRRGAAAAVVRDNKIYLLGGNTLGHNGGAVPWFDSYDPATGDWQILADAPNARDHFAAAIVGDKLIAAAGRRTTQPNPTSNPVMPTDIYSFTDSNWASGADIPTARAGTMIAATDSELLVSGGEINTNTDSLRTVEAYHPLTDQWRNLQPMIDPRHSGGAAVIDNVWHIVAGSNVRGGPLSGELSSHETLELTDLVSADSDEDGLSDADESALYNTDPEDADSDDDGLNDGQEIGLGSNPLDPDSDDDGLDDGQELESGSNPLDADSDDDGLSDGVESAQGTNLLDPDSDDDGLDDGQELDLGSNPLDADSDSDGLSDGVELAQGTDLLDQDSDDDELNDGLEASLGTDPLLPDSDNDGLSDSEEHALDSNPLDNDSDDDTLQDGLEVNTYGTSPTLADSDEDGLDDNVEIALGTDPLDRDTDADGLIDSEDSEPLIYPSGNSGSRKKSGLGAIGWFSLLLGGAGLLRTSKPKRQ
ncbi:MAG: hypothetical protein AB8B63_08895 [Granulosicoccus sp.]